MSEAQLFGRRFTKHSIDQVGLPPLRPTEHSTNSVQSLCVACPRAAGHAAGSGFAAEHRPGILVIRSERRLHNPHGDHLYSDVGERSASSLPPVVGSPATAHPMRRCTSADAGRRSSWRSSSCECASQAGRSQSAASRSGRMRRGARSGLSIRPRAAGLSRHARHRP